MGLKKNRLIFLVGIICMISSAVYSKSLTDVIELMKKKDYEMSIEILNEILTDNSEYAIAYNYRGYAFMMTEQYDKALEDYQKSDTLSSTPNSLSGIQWALLAIGNFKESIAVGYKILELDPTNYYAKYRVADAYLGMKDYKKAFENYKIIEIRHGKTGDLLWKQGLCDFYTGDKNSANQLFEEGKKLDPTHKGIQYSLANSDSYPQISFIPEYSSFTFRNSDFIGTGNKYGLGLSYSHNETWNFRASMTQDKSLNYNSTKGVLNYINDPLNIAYLAQYNYLQFPTSIPSYYLNQPINQYNLGQLLTSKDYIINKYSLGLTYKISERLAFHFSPQLLQSNTSSLNGGSAVQAGISYTNGYVLNFSAANINMPNNTGAQISTSVYFPFLADFYSSSTLTGQSLKVKSTETVYLSISPLSTTSQTVQNQKSYGFFQQEFGYNYEDFVFSVGGRYGTARTPLMGENWIYSGFDLLYGGYGQIGIKSDDLTLQIQYSQDRWLDSRNEKPISDNLKLMLIWRL